jgi:hypothetical protein
MVRAGRPGALQTAAQVRFVSIFEQYLAHLRCVAKAPSLGAAASAGTSQHARKERQALPQLEAAAAAGSQTQASRAEEQGTTAAGPSSVGEAAVERADPLAAASMPWPGMGGPPAAYPGWASPGAGSATAPAGSAHHLPPGGLQAEPVAVKSLNNQRLEVFANGLQVRGRERASMC